MRQVCCLMMLQMLKIICGHIITLRIQLFIRSVLRKEEFNVPNTARLKYSKFGWLSTEEY